jgi:hypothetical protein
MKIPDQNGARIREVRGRRMRRVSTKPILVFKRANNIMWG